MIKPLELFIGLKYTRAKRRNHFISFISLVSMLGITLGVWALITVLSVMNGFHNDLQSRILSVASHVTVQDYAGSLQAWPQVSEMINGQPGVAAAAPYILGQGMATNRGRVAGAIIRGVDPNLETGVSEVIQKLTQGSAHDLKAGDFGILLGDALANQLGLQLGDKVTLVAPKGRVTPAGLLPRLKRFTVQGVFKLGMYEYDNSLAVIHLADAAKLLQLGDGVSGLRVALDKAIEAPEIRQALIEHTEGQFLIRDWTQEHRNFFGALKVEKRVMFVILTLIIMVAAFNIVSTLIMLVTDKQADIAILRTLGLSPGGVMKIFMVQGTVIGTIGTLLGAVLGVLTALNVQTIVAFIEGLFGVTFFPADVYLISGFPSELRISDTVNVVLLSLALSFLATFYPAWRASKLQPADALRYE